MTSCPTSRCWSPSSWPTGAAWRRPCGNRVAPRARGPALGPSTSRSTTPAARRPGGPRSPDLAGGGGLGLHIVERLASRWGVRKGPTRRSGSSSTARRARFSSLPAGARPQARRGRDRRPHAVAVQPRQADVSRGGLRQGARHRLLHARVAGPAAAPARAAADPEAVSRRRRGAALLREAVPVAPAAVGADRRGGQQPRARRDDRLLPGQRPADARVAGQPRRPRAAHLAGAAEALLAADRGRLRPRPGRAGHDRRVRRGRAGAAHGVRAPRHGGVPEDLGLEGDAGLRAAERRA